MHFVSNRIILTFSKVMDQHLLGRDKVEGEGGGGFKSGWTLGDKEEMSTGNRTLEDKPRGF